METTIIAMIPAEHGTTTYRKVLTSANKIFRLPDSLDTSVEYNSGANLEDGEWFSLTNFSNKTYCLSLLKQKSFSSVNYDTIDSECFGKIVFLCGYQNGCYFFQRVTTARQVNQKRIFFLGEQCEYKENSMSISLNEYADAIYNSTENKLYFRKLRDISAIFDGIDELYREATEDEVKNFLNYNFIELSNGFVSDKVRTNNRKRIAKALEILHTFSEVEKKKVFKYIKDYCPEIADKNNKFRINNEDSLKKLLYGIEQRYYTTLIGKERRLANSVISLNQGMVNHD